MEQGVAMEKQMRKTSIPHSIFHISDISPNSLTDKNSKATCRFFFILFFYQPLSKGKTYAVNIKITFDHSRFISKIFHLSMPKACKQLHATGNSEQGADFSCPTQSPGSTITIRSYNEHVLSPGLLLKLLCKD